MIEKRDAIVKVEIPFCVRKCAFCTRDVIPGWDSARMRAYVDALVAEIGANADQFDDCVVRAVRIGGGIASNAGAGVADIVRALRRALPVADDAQVTMRASIANISGATMPFFRRAGVDRFDFEMLSLNPLDFVRLNRVDNLNDLPIVCDHFLHSYANDSLGLVLAFGHAAPEGEDAKLNVRRTALAAARTHASHVELVRCVPADESADRQLDEARDVLTGHGFVEYLPLRFARPGKEDRFALMKSAGAPQVGFGLGAVTRLDGVESENTHDLARYCTSSHDFAAITEHVRSLNAKSA